MNMTIKAGKAIEPQTANVCPMCGETVKLNELVRSPYHVLGCKRCYGKAVS